LRRDTYGGGDRVGFVFGGMSTCDSSKLGAAAKCGVVATHGNWGVSKTQGFMPMMIGFEFVTNGVQIWVLFLKYLAL
jgi:hypothetical protein